MYYLNLKTCGESTIKLYSSRALKNKKPKTKQNPSKHKSSSYPVCLEQTLQPWRRPSLQARENGNGCVHRRFRLPLPPLPKASSTNPTSPTTSTRPSPGEAPHPPLQSHRLRHLPITADHPIGPTVDVRGVGDQRPRHLEHDVVPEGGGPREHGEDLVHCGRHRQDPRSSRLHHRHPHPRQEPPHLHPLRRHGRLRHRRECGEGCGFGEEENAEAVQEALGEAGRDEDRDFRSAAAEDPGEDYRARRPRDAPERQAG